MERSTTHPLASYKYYCVELTTFWKQHKDCGDSDEELLFFFFVLMYSRTTPTDVIWTRMWHARDKPHSSYALMFAHKLQFLLLLFVCFTNRSSSSHTFKTKNWLYCRSCDTAASQKDFNSVLWCLCECRLRSGTLISVLNHVACL